MLDASLVDLADGIARGDFSAEEAASQCLEQIDARASLGAFLHVDREHVLAQARRTDERRSRGEPLGKLGGVPIAIKDALCTVDAPTTCASRILARGIDAHGAPSGGWRPPFDATAVARLRDAGAVLIGKTNMDEFAMGSSTENSGFYCTKNPWDPTLIPGGSSGGSAVSVAANMAWGALGSDTGGSIRQPAALCGVVGVKPSYGRVSRYGLVAFASSLDQVGPFARDVRGAARLLEVIAGHDPRDSTSAPRPTGPYEAACSRDIRGLRIGLPEQYIGQGLDRRIEQRVREALTALEREGAIVVPVSLPHTRYGVAAYYIVATAEASSNLARYDGVRFGLRVEPERGDLEAMYGATRDRGFGAEVKRRILLGTYVLSAGYYDAYYRRAQKVRTLIIRDFDLVFEQVDVLATPVTPTPAFRLGERLEDPLAMYLADIFTLPCNLAGICGLSVPAAPLPATEQHPELPVGLQLLAPAFGEERLFSVAAAWERMCPPRARHAPADAP
jgi:aspartyl-tRNA(Asn)/glutamyl-tRNA(Gln) amidotransferase subunit A